MSYALGRYAARQTVGRLAPRRFKRLNQKYGYPISGFRVDSKPLRYSVFDPFNYFRESDHFVENQFTQLMGRKMDPEKRHTLAGCLYAPFTMAAVPLTAACMGMDPGFICSATFIIPALILGLDSFIQGFRYESGMAMMHSLPELFPNDREYDSINNDRRIQIPNTNSWLTVVGESNGHGLSEYRTANALLIHKHVFNCSRFLLQKSRHDEELSAETLVVAGPTGSGKSHMIRRVLDELVEYDGWVQSEDSQAGMIYTKENVTLYVHDADLLDPSLLQKPGVHIIDMSTILSGKDLKEQCSQLGLSDKRIVTVAPKPLNARQVKEAHALGLSTTTVTLRGEELTFFRNFIPDDIREELSEPDPRIQAQEQLLASVSEDEAKFIRTLRDYSIRHPQTGHRAPNQQHPLDEREFQRYRRVYTRTSQLAALFPDPDITAFELLRWAWTIAKNSHINNGMALENPHDCVTLIEFFLLAGLAKQHAPIQEFSSQEIFQTTYFHTLIDYRQVKATYQDLNDLWREYNHNYDQSENDSFNIDECHHVWDFKQWLIRRAKQEQTSSAINRAIDLI